jgi:hypothetical protein
MADERNEIPSPYVDPYVDEKFRKSLDKRATDNWFDRFFERHPIIAFGLFVCLAVAVYANKKHADVATWTAVAFVSVVIVGICIKYRRITQWVGALALFAGFMLYQYWDRGWDAFLHDAGIFIIGMYVLWLATENVRKHFDNQRRVIEGQERIISLLEKIETRQGRET